LKTIDAREVYIELVEMLAPTKKLFNQMIKLFV